MIEHDFLLFCLQGPMAAFGEITVGERRSLWDAPSKSGVLGMLAACRGVRREDHESLAALDHALGFAVRVDCAGSPLRDYHTAQAPKESSRTKRKKQGLPINTRKDDLDCDDISTVLSERFYRVEARHTIALWVRPGQAYDLAQLKSAIMRPVFTPYLGRKTCPLGSPPQPLIITKTGLLAAFSHYDALAKHYDVSCHSKDLPLQNSEVWFQYGAGLSVEDEVAQQIRQRRDALRRRDLWQFSDRQEGKLIWMPRGESI